MTRRLQSRARQLQGKAVAGELPQSELGQLAVVAGPGYPLGMIGGRFRAQSADLPLAGWILFRFLALATIGAKALAAGLVCAQSGAASFGLLLAKALPRDLLYLAAIAASLMLARRLRLPGVLRPVALIALWTAYSAAVVLTFVDVGFFFYLGAPLRPELLRLAPTMASYLAKSFGGEAFGLLALAGLSVLGPLAVSPLLFERARRLPAAAGPARFVPEPWLATLLLLGAGLALGAVPAANQREAALRGLSWVSAIVPRFRVEVDARPLTRAQRDLLAGLLGPVDTSGQAAFAGLPRRRYSVVVWVWESVGERYLRSHHPLGDAETPELDRIAASGSVMFTRAFTECPLSVQTAWALFTGTSPPGSPTVFKLGRALPPHPPLLPAVLKPGGYRTSYFNGSYLKAWGEDRIASLGGLDVFEDLDTLANRSRFGAQAWSIDNRAVLERFREWLATVPADDPFFSVVWAAETHHPYRWVGMPAAIENADAAVRYRQSIERSDAQLGELHAMLQVAGRLADTILVVVGDHGQGLARGPHPDDLAHSQHVYEDDLHVPFVVVHPGLPPGVRTAGPPCTHADLYPTLLDLLGIAVPAGVDGVSLARPVPPRVLVARAVTWWPLSIRAGRYKLIEAEPEGGLELYDWIADPTESHEASHSGPEIVAALRAKLHELSARRRRSDPTLDALDDPGWLREPGSWRP